MKKKSNKHVKMEIILGTILSLVLIIGGSMWFNYKKPQTVWQYFLSYVGYNALDVKAASKIVFLGDSITFQENWNVLMGVSNIDNAGVPGNTTDDVLNRLDGIISSKPQKLFLMIGANDLIRGRDVSYIFANYEKIISEIKTKSPDTIIYLQSMLPVNKDILVYGNLDSQKINQEIVQLNSLIASLANQNKILFINLHQYFCGEDNELYFKYAPDGLHPNSYGYAVWKKVIIEYIKQN